VHELSIADAILDTVRTEAKTRGVRVTKVGLRLGAISGVDPDALSFGFNALVDDSDLAPLALEIEAVAQWHYCQACDNEFVVEAFTLQCPTCGTLAPHRVSGDEMEIAWLEVEA
jgi:hydrogenase nickel incorporation protein HypA/HybF